MLQRPYISIVMPTFNEEKNIGKAIRGVKKALNGYSYEIIVVDHYSTDKTVKIAKSLGAKVLFENVGKGYALIKGLKNAKGKIQISMDADLSHRPNELKLLIAGIEAGYDICLGSRFINGGGSDDMPLIRRIGNKIFVYMVNIFFHANYSDLCYGYRSFRKGVLRKLDLKETGWGIETEMNIKAAKRHLATLEVPSFEKARRNGEGNLKTFRDGYVILKTIFKNLYEK